MVGWGVGGSLIPHEPRPPAPGVIKTQRPITDPETGRPSDALAVPFPSAVEGKKAQKRSWGIGGETREVSIEQQRRMAHVGVSAAVRADEANVVGTAHPLGGVS